jgi:hypothetical protein
MSKLNEKRASKLNNYYSFDEAIIKKADEYISSFTKNFEDNNIQINTSTDIGMNSIMVYPMLKQLEEYYNEEICISLGIVLSLLESNEEDLRIKSYHTENLLFRLISIWDYYYNIINQYLNLEIPVDNIVKKEMTKRYCTNIDFVKAGAITKVVQKPLQIEKQQEIRKECKYIRILGKDVLINRMKKEFELTDRFEKIIKLMNSNEIKKLKNIRNQIIHRRTLGAKISIDSGWLGGQAISIKNSGWIDFKELSKLIEKNVDITYQAIKILHEIIFLDEWPNSIKNKGIKFFKLKVKCVRCKEESIVPETQIKEPEGIVCTKCWKFGVEIIERIVTNEYNYENSFIKYIKGISENIDKI